MPSENEIITSFQLLNQEIINFYQSDLDPVEKWTKIAILVQDRNELINQIFVMLKKESMRKEIYLDYQSDLKKLVDRIGSENNLVVKSSLIITSMHLMIYDLMSTKGNYYTALDGQNEMHVLKKKLMYYVFLSDKTEKNVYFHAFILLFALESLFNRHFYLGIDFEYTNKKIQMAQLNFEHNKVPQSTIMIVSPNELEPFMMKNFVNLIICNKYIKKILHGSDSLDIPYMYEHMLENDPHKIIRFTRTMIDTRFLCEYYKLNHDESDSKCSIYDNERDRSAIFFFNVISEEQQDRLAALLDSMPPVFDITWNIHKLEKSKIAYAFSDVLYLKWFYYKIIQTATKDTNNDLEKKAIIDLYKHVLAELTQLVYLERREIVFLIAKAKNEVDPINNFMIRNKNGINKLIDIFNELSVGLTTSNPQADIDKIVKVNYYRTLVSTLIKKMIYTILSKKCKIYKDKNTIWTDKLDNQYVFDFLHKMNFLWLEKMFIDINGTLERRIKILCS